MKDPEVLKLLQRAAMQLKQAGEELSRPSGDVVAYSVCSRARGGITDLLTAFLLMNNADPAGAHDLEELRRKCASIDGRFAELELSEMDCHPAKIGDEECYCLGTGRVKECLQIANRVREMVGPSCGMKEKSFSN